MNSNSSSPNFAERENVDIIELDGRTIYIVGTAHVSKSSADLAEEVIRAVNPDSVAVELCESRYHSLRDPDRWKNTDIFAVVKEGKAYVLMAQLALAAFQRKLGAHLEVKPGAEMMRAIEVSDEIGAETVHADREVKTTLKRTWASLSLWSMGKVLVAMIGGLFTSERMEEDEIERLKSSDALEELMRDFSEALPDVQRALIAERDQFLAAKIRESPGETVVGVVGAGHVPGIKEWIHKEIDIEELSTLPPPKLSRRLIAWAIPLFVLSLICYGFYSSGADKSVEMITSWVWINALFGGLGALVALAHPFTILVAVIVSPFTSLNPFIAAGWVAGLVEAWIRKPKVSDLQTIADDITSVGGIWRNRVSRILLVICLTNLFGTIGTFLGAWKLWSVK